MHQNPPLRKLTALPRPPSCGGRGSRFGDSPYDSANIP